MKNEKVEVVKEGIPAGEHECKWAYSSVNSSTPDHITEVKRICRICGKVEQITQTRENSSFEEVYKVFHGKD